MRVDCNVHALSARSTAYALPQLRALGWRFELPGDYPFQVVGDDAPWYAHVGGDDGDKTNWFNLSWASRSAGVA